MGRDVGSDIVANTNGNVLRKTHIHKDKELG